MKQQHIELLAPMSGKVCSLEDVPDEVFSAKMVGDGVALEPSEGVVYAPMDGEVAALFPTGHALGIRSPQGLEVLVHIGVDTVELKGEGFSLHVEKGQSVKAGDKLVTVDLGYVARHAPSILTPVVLTSMDAVASWALLPGEMRGGISPLMDVVLK